MVGWLDRCDVDFYEKMSQRLVSRRQRKAKNPFTAVSAKMRLTQTFIHTNSRMDIQPLVTY